eukprot:scaffold8505_cov130-Cylindrotheca_fusiformis.AAC.16
MVWSLEDYCASQHGIDYGQLPESSRIFLEALNLPSVYPFCTTDGPSFHLEGVPPLGPLDHRFDGESMVQKGITAFYMIAPPLLAIAELWIRLFAGYLGPIGIVYLLLADWKDGRNSAEKANCSSSFPWICALTVASTLVLSTDTLYVLHNGEIYGVLLFSLSVLLSIRAAFRYKLKKLGFFVTIMVLCASHLVFDYETNELSFGNKVDQVRIDEGLYYDSSNPTVASIVQNWPERFRTYSRANGATAWISTGDARTGLTFLANHVPKQEWNRLFLETEDQEYVALDVCFPESGFNSSNPIYMVLHGLNGGSDEGYVRDLAYRRRAEGSTIVVMVARGLMDLPVRGWNLFHGARTMDVHRAATTLRRAVSDDQTIVGVGYSMGAIILSNYLASYGSEVPLDGALAISGGLDMRYQQDFFRAQRLWQPMLTESTRGDFFLGKWGNRIKARLSESNFLKLMRSKHITELDTVGIAPYSGFDNVTHYYRTMSVLGDMAHKPDGSLDDHYKGKKVDSIAVPLVVLHAMDDPLLSWRATCANEGLMNPKNLVKTGTGNLMILLTKAGGHVGWPVGFFFFQNNWKWMSDVAMSLATAVQAAKQRQLSDKL